MQINKDILLNDYFNEALEKIKEIVSIPGYRKNLEKGTPVDKDIVKVLDYTLNLCEEFGWKTSRHKDGLYGFADIGTGEKLFGIICHLDVVPPGNIEEWNTDPFVPEVIDGKLYGRGTFDDKGPTMINIYSLKYLLDNGFEPDYTIRLIFGTSEETTWECMDAYVKNERICDLGYVPDGHFPVVYAEKWIVDADMTGEFKCDFELIGGEIYNAVNDLVKYKGPKIPEIKQFLDKNNINSVLKEEVLIIKGISAHGSLPEKGVSASTWACKALDSVGIKHPLVQFVSKYAHINHQMEEIFGDLSDETGLLTACNGIFNISKEKYLFTFNFRVPCTRDPKKDVFEKLKSFIKEFNFDLKLVSLEDSVYFKKDSDVVTKIMDVYKEVTGDHAAEPIAIGGGTFAKSMPNLIAFGAEFNAEESTMHAYNEYVKIEDLKKMMEIYTKSIVKLTKI